MKRLAENEPEEKERANMSLFSMIRQLFGKKTPQGPKELIEIYVGNLSYDMNDAQLRKLFAKYGTVKRASESKKQAAKRPKPPLPRPASIS